VEHISEKIQLELIKLHSLYLTAAVSGIQLHFIAMYATKNFLLPSSCLYYENFN